MAKFVTTIKAVSQCRMTHKGRKRLLVNKIVLYTKNVYKSRLCLKGCCSAFERKRVLWSGYGIDSATARAAAPLLFGVTNGICGSFS